MEFSGSPRQKKERGRMTERGSKKERAKNLAKDLAKEGLGAAKEATTEKSSREDKGEGVLDKARGRLKDAEGVSRSNTRLSRLLIAPVRYPYRTGANEHP